MGSTVQHRWHPLRYQPIIRSKKEFYVPFERFSNKPRFAPNKQEKQAISASWREKKRSLHMAQKENMSG